MRIWGSALLKVGPSGPKVLADRDDKCDWDKERCKTFKHILR